MAVTSQVTIRSAGTAPASDYQQITLDGTSGKKGVTVMDRGTFLRKRATLIQVPPETAPAPIYFAH